MLVNLNDILPRAQREHYAVGLFNAVTLELAQGIIAAAERGSIDCIMSNLFYTEEKDEALPFSDVLFEVASAVGTVGLTVGITPSLSSFSHIILMLLMFAGRIGGLTIIVAFAERREHAKLTRPTEKILIG